jgi:hypothetical protein
MPWRHLKASPRAVNGGAILFGIIGCVMSHPDALDLYNECLSIVEETTDDRTAERVLLIAVRLLQLADEDFARHLAQKAANDFEDPPAERSPLCA